MEIRKRKNFTINLFNLGMVCFPVITVFLVLSVVTVLAGPTIHSVPGSTCAAYSNSQADALERNHARIYNPKSNSKNIYVICGVARILEDVASTSYLPFAEVNVFFNSGVTHSVSCAVRELESDNVHIPGVTPDSSNIINAVATAIAPPLSRPGVNYGRARFTVNDIDTAHLSYYTLSCRLPPGTGINSIDFVQQ